MILPVGIKGYRPFRFQAEPSGAEKTNTGVGEMGSPEETGKASQQLQTPHFLDDADFDQTVVHKGVRTEPQTPAV
jgi:hypothetical protein